MEMGCASWLLPRSMMISGGGGLDGFMVELEECDERRPEDFAMVRGGWLGGER